jgi:hypothetical protein
MYFLFLWPCVCDVTIDIPLFFMHFTGTMERDPAVTGGFARDAKSSCPTTPISPAPAVSGAALHGSTVPKLVRRLALVNLFLNA